MSLEIDVNFEPRMSTQEKSAQTNMTTHSLHIVCISVKKSSGFKNVLKATDAFMRLLKENFKFWFKS